MDTLHVRTKSRTVVYMAALTLMTLLGSAWPAEAALQNITINKPLFGSYTTTGLPVSNYRQVSLTLNPPAGSSTMSFRNESDAWSAAEPAAATKQWTLSAPDADKSVSVEFKNSLNAIVGTFSDKTRLDYIIDTSYFSPAGSNNYANTTYTNLKTSGNAVAVQPDQKVVVVGTDDSGGGNSKLRVIRYNTDGTPDTTFGAGTGTVWYGNSTGAYTGNAVAIQPNGKIVVVGTYQAGSRFGIWLLRLTNTGELDPAFNTAGGLGGGYLVKTAFGSNTVTTGNAVTLQPDGKIVVVGTFDNGGANNTSPWILRYNADGTPDLTFNSTGDVIISSSIAGPHVGNAVALDAVGRIIVVGTYNAGGSYVWATRLTSVGQLDTAFGAGTGSVFYGNSSSGNAGNAVAVNPTTGKIDIVGTWDWTGGNTDIWLMQLNSNGTLDSAFNPNASGYPPGSVALGGTYADTGSAVAIQADGKILVAGTYDNSLSGTSLFVERINADSSYDITFNRGNPAYSYGTNGYFAGKGLALQSDNKIVVAGYGYGSTGFGLSKISYTTMFSMRLFDHMLPLTVTTVGSGAVSANLGDVTWTGTTGSADYLPGTSVDLVATPVGGAAFIGWSGDCAGIGVCTVTMASAKNVTATFSLPVALNLTVSGTGTITASSDQGVIACTGSCSNDLPLNTAVNLAATPAWYTTFTGWSGDCTGTGACSVTMSQSRNITGLFGSNLNVRLNGTSLYSKLWDAYSGVAPGATSATIEAQVFAFLENLQLNDTLLTVSLTGGLGSNFTANPGTNFTAVKGSLKISGGRLNVKYIKVQ